MKVLFDPVWPWPPLHSFLAETGPGVRLATALVALLAFALPVWYQRPPWGLRASARRGPLLAGTGAVVVLLLGYLGRAAWLARSGPHGLLPAWLVLLMVLLLGLAGLCVSTYLGAPGVPRRRVSAVVALRLAALLLTSVAIVRPSLAFVDRTQARRQLIVLLDGSKSMTIEDETGSERSRWGLLLRCLRESEPALQRLRDSGVEVLFYKFAGEVGPFDPANPGDADGKHTDIGGALRALLERRDGRVRLAGLLLISDGADHGTSTPALAEVARWRALPCLVHTFGCGKPTSSLKQADVAITGITTRPAPFVPVKGRLTVKVTIDARGYENSKATLRLFLEEATTRDGQTVLEDREKAVKEVVLGLTTGNEVEIACDAPATPGEVKVKVTVETPQPDTFPANNTIETFVTVSKDGVSVLLVDRLRAWEPARICDSLSENANIRVTPVWLGGKGPVDGNAGRLFQTEEQPYDVIILGDVTAAQLQAADKDALAKIEKLVANGAGLVMLGGYASFAKQSWAGTAIEKLLPVRLTEGNEGESEQREDAVRMVPTSDGLLRTPYLFRLDDSPKPEAVWERLPMLNGMSVLYPQGNGTLSLARTQDKKPLLVMKEHAATKKGGKAGKPARVLAFGGASTWRWVRNPEGEALHARFWKQVVMWLAHQEDAEGSVWVKPDVRRLPVRGELNFQVGLRGKGGGPDVAGGTYRVEVVRPDGTKASVPVRRGGSEDRGAYVRTEAPGTYRIQVHGKGKGPGGEVIEGDASARVIVYDEDLEMTRVAADHEYLRKLAAAGGGEHQRVEQLAAFLERLRERPEDRERLRLDLRPDWRRTTRSPFLVGFFLLFVTAVSAEWALRRRWGMV
jgi:hypothetical protein